MPISDRVFENAKIGGKSIRHLNIGHSIYISFVLHSTKMIYLYDILDKCPHLSHLYLNDMDIDQQAMVQINKDLEDIVPSPNVGS